MAGSEGAPAVSFFSSACVSRWAALTGIRLAVRGRLLVNASRTYGLRRLLWCGDAVVGCWCLTDFGCCERALVSLLGCSATRSLLAMACCAKPKKEANGGAPKKPAVDRQTEFMLEEHGWAFTRIAQLCVPKIARATGALPHALRRRRGSDAPAHGPPLLCNAARC